MPKISQLREREVRKIAIDVGEGDFLNIEYFPNKITLNLSEEIKGSEDEREIVGLYLSVVKGWDLEDDDGKPLPMNIETAGDLGVELLKDILEGLRSADSPKEQTSNT